MNRMDTLDRLAIPPVRGEMVDDVNAPDDEDLLIELDLADRVGGQFFDRDLARCQRACKGARQSARGRGDDVVERRRVRLVRVRADAVMLRDRAMESKPDRFLFSRQPGQTDRASFTLDVDFRSVHDVAHALFSFSTSQDTAEGRLCR